MLAPCRLNQSIAVSALASTYKSYQSQFLVKYTYPHATTPVTSFTPTSIHCCAFSVAPTASVRWKRGTKQAENLRARGAVELEEAEPEVEEEEGCQVEEVEEEG